MKKAAGCADFQEVGVKTWQMPEKKRFVRLVLKSRNLRTWAIHAIFAAVLGEAWRNDVVWSAKQCEGGRRCN